MASDARLERIAEAESVEFTRTGDTVSLGSASIDNYSDGSQWFDIAVRDIIPRKGPRGDLRERMVNLLVRDAVQSAGNTREEKLLGKRAKGGEEPEPGAFAEYELIADAAKRPVFGEILFDHYAVEPTRTTRFLFPFQTDIPGNFVFPGRYKLFNGIILAFFAKPGSGDGFNEELLERFYALFNGNDELSLLDQHVLNIARAVAGAGAGRVATAAQLLDGERKGFAGQAADPYRVQLDTPVFMPEVHELIQRDLERALSMKSLGRRDRVNAVLILLYLHLSLFFWRSSYVLEEQVRALLSTLAGEQEGLDALRRAGDLSLSECAFRGQLLFRVATARPRRISEGAPAARSFQDLNNQRLRLFPVNLSLLAAARRFTGMRAPASFADIGQELDADSGLKASFNAATRAAALAVAEPLAAQQRADIEAAAEGGEPGLIALRSAIIKRWRSDLRRSSTDITSGLMKRGSKGIFATRGSVQYFELGQDLLLLLTKLIAGEDAMRYRDFLNELSLYGLAPQDKEEEAVLADVLRSLQLLEKFSDTGEAMYVKHFL